MSATDCPRAAGLPDGPLKAFKFLNKPDDGTCDFCGSLQPDIFMARLEAGDVELVPTDKSYKVYVRNIGGQPFAQAFRTDEPSKPGEILKDPHDQSHWTWETRELSQAKFYFEHLSEAQMRRFVDLLNQKRLRIGYPGHFYRLPYFVSN